MVNPEQMLLDTDIVIHLLKKQPEVVAHFIELQQQGVEMLLSPIVVAEIYAGAFAREYADIEGFFGLCQYLSFGERYRPECGDIRQSVPQGVSGCLPRRLPVGRHRTGLSLSFVDWQSETLSDERYRVVPDERITILNPRFHGPPWERE